MSIGVAIFASVVLVLVVYHKTFRKVFFWVTGVAAVGCGLFFGGVYLYDRHQEEKAAIAHKNLVDDCTKRYATSGYVDSFFAPRGGTLDVRATCESNPAMDWRPEFIPNAPYSSGPAVPVPQGATLADPIMPKKPKTSGPKIMATIIPSSSKSTEPGFGCLNVILWNNPSYEPERQALLKFKGGEKVEYVGKAPSEDIVRYQGMRGYVNSSCVAVDQ